MKDHPTFKGVVCVLFSILVWSGWMVASRYGVEGTLSAYDITALRFGVAGMLLLPWAFKHGLALGPYGLKGGLLIAFLIGAPYTNITITGMMYAPVSHASTLINGSLLILTTIVGIRYLKEPTSPSHLMGVGFSLAGIACMLVATSGGSSSEWLGHMLFMVGGLMWGSSVLLVRAWRSEPLQVAIVVCVWSLILYMPFYFLFVPSHIGLHNWHEVVFQGVYQGAINSIAAFITFNIGIQLLGAARVGSMTPLVPVLSTLLAIPILGEHPSALEWTGVAAVSFGVFLASGLLSWPWRGKHKSVEAGVIAEGN